MNSTFPSGLLTRQYASGGVIAIVAILMVFLVLLAIIVITELIGKLINSATKAEPVVEAAAPVSAQTVRQQLNLDDEDAVVAALVASIDYRNETKKNIQVVSVKEVK